MAESKSKKGKPNGHGASGAKGKAGSANGAKEKKLTLKEENFLHELPLNGYNATEAARAAGYRGSYDVLRKIGSENLTKPHIATRVRARIEGLAATADEVLALLGEHLRADLADLADCIAEDGALDLRKAKQLGVSRQLKTMTTRVLTRRLASGAEEREVHTRIELHDSQSAAAHLIKVLGIAQKAGENKGDAERKAKAREEAIKLTMDTYNVGEDDAIRILSGMPEASDLVQ